MRGRGFAVASTSTALPRALDLFVGDLFLFRRWRSIPAARARPGTMHHACMHGLPAPGARQPVSNRRPAAKNRWIPRAASLFSDPHTGQITDSARAHPRRPRLFCVRGRRCSFAGRPARVRPPPGRCSSSTGAQKCARQRLAGTRKHPVLGSSRSCCAR